jgi:hypothetical protein
VKPSTITFRKTFGYSLAAVMVLYLLVSLYLLFVPRSVFLSRKVTQYYNWFFLPGPYFRDDRIRLVPHLTISSKPASGVWSVPRNIELENFQLYHEGFVYGKLKRSRYERFLAKSVSRSGRDAETIQQKKPFRELHKYLKFHYLPGDTDSVRIIYQFEILADRDSLTPLFELKYKLY